MGNRRQCILRMSHQFYANDKTEISADYPLTINRRRCCGAIRPHFRCSRVNARSKILTTINAQFCSDEDDSTLRQTGQETPDLFAFDCGQLPFERMGDAHFELLLADLYASRAADGSEDWYDKARRLNDGADQGRDVILFNDSSPVGVIQCKRYNGIVSSPWSSRRSANSSSTRPSSLALHQHQVRHFAITLQFLIEQPASCSSSWKRKAGNASKI